MPVYINYATESDLTLLPGVGEARAAAIMEGRRRYGNILNPQMLQEVLGYTIPDHVVDKISFARVTEKEYELTGGEGEMLGALGAVSGIDNTPNRQTNQSNNNSSPSRQDRRDVVADKTHNRPSRFSYGLPRTPQGTPDRHPGRSRQDRREEVADYTPNRPSRFSYGLPRTPQGTPDRHHGRSREVIQTPGLAWGTPARTPVSTLEEDGTPMRRSTGCLGQPYQDKLDHTHHRCRSIQGPPHIHQCYRRMAPGAAVTRRMMLVLFYSG